MAKKKTVEAEVIENPAPETEITENVEVEATEQAEVNEALEKEVKRKKTATVQASTELPDSVKDVLKVFDTYPELYITATGAVYTPDTKLSEDKGAILYKNPYYNS